MKSKQYRIGELAEKAGVTRRTIHYYLSRGLLPSPDGAGLGTTYTDEHLYRVMLIKKYQEAYLPLEEIKKRLDRMLLEEVKEALDKKNFTAQVQEQITDENMANDRAYTGNGQPYARVNIGFGLEIHFPLGNEKAERLAEELSKYAKKIMKEG
jgi:DNA-binding transcriptional MerR regulator